MGSFKTLASLILIVFLVACSSPEQNIPDVVESPEPSPTTEPPVPSATPAPRVLQVDDYGANPFDEQPDNRAIQAALDDLQPGETLQFTSGGGVDGYQGYLISETLFIVSKPAIKNITLTSTDPTDPAELIATEDLLGFVIRLYSRAGFHFPGQMDNITLQHLAIDAGRDVRICAGADGIPNGLDDNWGSVVRGECPVADDPWCNAGGISLAGAVDFGDYSQDYRSNPSSWSTGLVVDNVLIRNVECGTALGISGAESAVTNTTIDTAGEHTHVLGCAATDPDGELAFWSDGITFDGTNFLVENNTIINASDIGIVFFGGKDTRIINNTILSTEGNYGAFAGIQVGPVGFGDISGLEVSGNTVISTSHPVCGGLHTGINIGQQMWNKGCVGEAGSGSIGNVGSCVDRPQPPGGTPCIVGELCQIWGFVPAGESIYLRNNLVRGAHINYLVQGLEIEGSFEITSNVSEAPQKSDWEAAAYGCNGHFWGPIDYAAWAPTIDGWQERVIHCER